MKIQLEHHSRHYTLDLTQRGQSVTFTLDGKSHTIEILRAGEGWLDLRFSDSSAVHSVVVSVDGPKRWVTLNGQTFALTQSTGPSKRGGLAHHAAGELLAPMPGQIRAVQAAEGDIVTKGQALVIVEAMKMEIKVAAPFEGVVKKVNVKPGQAVEKDELLVEIESKIRED